ncbi:MAG TPA: delta(1)-pyrroline-2-carboxylate reductase family protein [Noviherbaspirillum sp.]
MRLLDPAATALALPYDKLVPAIADAAVQLARGEIQAPERMVVPIDSSSVLLCMPAIGSDIGVTKLITVHGNNARHELPAIQGEVTVFERDTGRRLLLLDGPTVTARRTAAVTMLGIQRLLPRVPQSALLIGCGVQAAAHADALAEVFGVARLFVAGRDPAHAASFCEMLAARHPGIDVQAASTAASRDVDVVIALTTARSPVIPADLPPTTMAIGVGAFKPEMAELPPALLHARRIVVDHFGGAKHEAGDLLQAGIDWSGVRELAEVVEHGVPASDAVPVFKTVGQAAWDLAAARVARAALGA